MGFVQSLLWVIDPAVDPDQCDSADLLGRFRPEPIESLLFAPSTLLAAPALLDIEVLQALRRLDLCGAIPSSRGDLVESLRALRIRRYPHASLLDDVWALRRNVSAHDAAYVAPARQLDATLVTRDARLAAAPGLDVVVVTP
jgi:predicted nucleic acid-binding protein